MHVLLDLVSRIVFLLVLLAALGATPAALLGRRWALVSRVAISPILGLCLGVSLFTTLAWFFPARDTDWLLPAVAFASLVGALALRSPPRLRIGRPRDALGWLSLVLVAACVSGPTVYTFHQHHSVGPGAFGIWDADGYVAATDGAVDHSLREQVRMQPPWRDLEQHLASAYAAGFQNLDAHACRPTPTPCSGWARPTPGRGT